MERVEIETSESSENHLEQLLVLRTGGGLQKFIRHPYVHIKKQRHYFANKGRSSQSYGFPVVMYGCESWTIKKAEH